MSDIRMYSRVSIADILETLTDHLDQDELFEFIKLIDLSTADWDFTNRLSIYFNEELEKCEREEAVAQMDEPEW